MHFHLLFAGGYVTTIILALANALLPSLVASSGCFDIIVVFGWMLCRRDLYVWVDFLPQLRF
jgi:hypothetical protein